MPTDKLPDAYSTIILATDEQGQEIELIFTRLPDGVDLVSATASGNVISLTEISAGFAEAGRRMRLPLPGVDQMTALANTLNILRVTDETQRVSPPDSPPLARIKRALRILQSDLPVILGARSSLVSSKDNLSVLSSEKFAAAARLNTAVEVALPLFVFAERGKRRQPWHNRADLIACSAIACWKSAGRQKLGVGKPTSPPVLFTEWALERLGERDVSNEAISADTISKALYRRRKDIGNYRAVISFEPRE